MLTTLVLKKGKELMWSSGSVIEKKIDSEQYLMVESTNSVSHYVWYKQKNQQTF